MLMSLGPASSSSTDWNGNPPFGGLIQRFGTASRPHASRASHE
jgi:hypothetical protein